MRGPLLPVESIKRGRECFLKTVFPKCIIYWKILSEISLVFCVYNNFSPKNSCICWTEKILNEKLHLHDQLLHSNFCLSIRKWLCNWFDFSLKSGRKKSKELGKQKETILYFCWIFLRFRIYKYMQLGTFFEAVYSCLNILCFKGGIIP